MKRPSGADDGPRLGIRLHGGLAPQRCVELAVAAEARGFTSAWFAENPLERGALPALAACAAATRRIELGVGVWNPFLRHPAQIAMDASALDELAEGRLTLGIGAGLAAPIRRLGIDNAKTLAALEDTFAIVRGLLAGETVTYKGKVFAVEDAKLSYKPRRPRAPARRRARVDSPRTTPPRSPGLRRRRPVRRNAVAPGRHAAGCLAAAHHPRRMALS